MTRKRTSDHTRSGTTRRKLLGAAASTAAVAVAGCRSGDGVAPTGTGSPSEPRTRAPQDTEDTQDTQGEGTTHQTRTLGNTGAQVEVVSLGGEGILRTTNNHAKAVPMIERALQLGVRYCDTAPAYRQSQDYYGAAFKNLGSQARDRVFLASKTHLRERDASLALLDDSLERLNTDRLDVWQLHDLRTPSDLDRIFAKGGAIEAIEKAKADGRVRFAGITGHHDASILVEAMRRYPFDTVLCAINPSDRARSPVLTSVLPEARKRKVGVIGMKVMAAGRLLQDDVASPETLIAYAASHADTVIIGCSSISEVKQNLAVRGTFKAMDKAGLSKLEARVAKNAARYDYFKA